jgi:hypothetical protein
MKQFFATMTGIRTGIAKALAIQFFWADCKGFCTLAAKAVYRRQINVVVARSKTQCFPPINQTL